MNNRITLSSFSSGDRKWLSELLIDKDVRKFLPHLTTDVDVFTNDMEIAERNGLGKFWIIRLGGVGIGFISIYDLTEKPFIFYAILSAYRNKGYMKRSLQMLDLSRFDVLYTCVERGNVPSLRVLAGAFIKPLLVYVFLIVIFIKLSITAVC